MNILETIQRLKELEPKASLVYPRPFPNGKEPFPWVIMCPQKMAVIATCYRSEDAEVYAESRNALPQLIECLEEALLINKSLVEKILNDANSHNHLDESSQREIAGQVRDLSMVFKKKWGILNEKAR